MRFSACTKRCVPPHSSRYSLDTFSRLGEGFYHCALCKKLGCSSQPSLPAAPDSRTQSATPWHADFNRRRTCAARPKGESLLSSGRFRLSPATGWGGRWQGPLPVLFNRLLRHTQVLCCFPCTPRATALRQARVSGGNLQNCAPSAAYGGAMTQERNVPLCLRRYCAKEESYSHPPPQHCFIKSIPPQASSCGGVFNYPSLSPRAYLPHPAGA